MYFLVGDFNFPTFNRSEGYIQLEMRQLNREDMNPLDTTKDFLMQQIITCPTNGNKNLTRSLPPIQISFAMFGLFPQLFPTTTLYAKHTNNIKQHNPLHMNLKPKLKSSKHWSLSIGNPNVNKGMKLLYEGLIGICWKHASYT